METAELKTEEVVAAVLKYIRGESAPVVLEGAKGHAALRILELARLHGIPVVEHEVAPLLSGLKKNTPIDESLFEAVARIYAYLVQMDSRQEI
ncbi:MAG: EscU/YscU/HrcU family type III secretion system export apparatus switch protein [Spirochaetia bacterium]|nr:EscU/YscU/HrcU family type III secretion system export apparatus switch protein [Spirochaetia bacterium]